MVPSTGLTPPTAGPEYGIHEWFMTQYLDINVTGMKSIVWAAGAVFVAPRRAIQSRPRAIYKLMLDLLREDSPLHCQNRDTLNMAMIFERLWFPLLDVRYTGSLRLLPEI